MNDRQEIIYTLMKIVDKAQAIHKNAMHFSTDSRLTLSKIHMIVSIAESHEPHVLGLAKELGITKGAVSQIVKKLENKGMIIKIPDPDNRSRYFLELTTKGRQAYNQHNEFHDLVNATFMHVLDKVPDDNIDLLFRTVQEIDNGVDDLLLKM